MHQYNKEKSSVCICLSGKVFFHLICLLSFMIIGCDNGDSDVDSTPKTQTWNSSESFVYYLAGTGPDYEYYTTDTGNIYQECFIGEIAKTDWGEEGFSFSDPTDHSIEWCRFRTSGFDAYLYGKDESGKWALVRYIQGDMWGGSHCGTIEWNIPEPLPINDKEINLQIDVYRDASSLLSIDNSWIMFAVNTWFSSSDLPEGIDINGNKPLVLDLVFFHDCNWEECGLQHFEDDDAYHYQVVIGETPFQELRVWTFKLNQYIDQALDYQWPSGSISYVKETLKLYQLDFVIELKNAEGAATIDNFAITYKEINSE